MAVVETRRHHVVEPLLSIAEVVEILGVSEQTLYRLLREGELIPVRIRGRTLFEPSVVEEFIASRRGAGA
jgi:excisionase family DNA binding protein